MGNSLQDYANFGMWNYGSDGQTLASTNNHNGTVNSQGKTIATTGKATTNFVERRNAGKLNYDVVVPVNKKIKIKKMLSFGEKILGMI